MMHSQIELVKEAIRENTDRTGASEKEVFETLKQSDKATFERLTATYERLQANGEIYCYPKGGVRVVKITDEWI